MNALPLSPPVSSGRWADAREAVEVAINEDRMQYSDGSLVGDADSSGLAAVIARAAHDRQAVILCYEDRRRRIVEAPPGPGAD